MIIALGFLLPCLFYFVVFVLCSRKPTLRPWLGIGSLVLTVFIAIISTLTVLVVLRFLTNWPARTQFEWTGVEFVGQPFMVGGEREQGIIGWPNESFLPTVKFWTTDQGRLRMEISGGQAFLYDEKQGVFLNGDIIPQGSVKARGDFSIRLTRNYHFWQRVEVLDSSNQVWASFDLPATLIRRSRVYSLAERVSTNAVPGIRENPVNIVKLENWANGLRLLLTRQGELRLLGEGNQQAECQLPCNLSLAWINRRLLFEVNQDGARLALCFPPPRQLLSPIPPPVENIQQLVVTASPRPGDFAFTLPLGSGIQDPRRAITFSKDDNGVTVITSPGVSLGESRRLPYLPERVQPAAPTPCAESGVTSSLAVQSGNAIFNFATVNDLPSLRLVVVLLLPAFVCFIFGMLLIFPRMPDDRMRWFLYGLMGTLWNLLIFRLLLSLRYSISLSSLDSLVIKGVVTAFVSLVVVPGIIVLIARFKRDISDPPQSDKAKKYTLIATLCYLVVLFGTAAGEYLFAPRIWINLPQRFAVSVSSPVANYVLLALAILAFFYFVIVSFALYKTVAAQSARRKKAIKFFLWPFSDFVSKLARRSKRMWSSTEADQPWSRSRALAFLIVIALISATFFLLPRLIAMAAAVVSKVVPIETFVHELLIPFFFFWPLAIIWLASKSAFPPGVRLPSFRKMHKNPSLRRRITRVLLLAFATITVPVFLLPVGIHDVGSILGALAIMLPTVAILLASPSRRWGGIALLAICLGLGSAIYYYANIGSISPYLPEGIQVASSRLLVFKEANQIQRLMPFTSVFGGHLQNLRHGYQHTWENQAIAYEGGLLGLGFGNAPTERSQVRQDTLQFDSVFSFFIASEHGLIGGLLLILLFAVPLLQVLLVARARFDIGHAVAVVAASSLLLEALFHAGMNLNLLPFTGRNLPLLTVNSVSDLARWTILLSFIVISLLSKYRRDNDLRDSAVSLLTPAPAPTNRPVQTQEQLTPYASLVIISGVLPFLLFLGLVVTSFQIWRDQSKQLSSPFTWNGILGVVDRMARDEFIIVKPDNTLTLRPSLNLSAGVLIDQEIARFNALPQEERIGQATSATLYRINNVQSRAQYDHLLDESRKKSLEYRGRRVSLFKLLPPLKWNDGTTIREIGGYRLVANREFNTQVSFKVGIVASDFPRTTFRDEQAPLIGPAWVRGKWVQTFDPDPAIPWTEILKGALEAEWKRLGKTTAGRRYGVLSLDRKLQEVTSEFVARKGRELHDQHLKRKQEMSALPPRVALSILDIKSGEILGMGGWPRMTSGKFWKRSSEGNEWFPPAKWLQDEAPQAIKMLYEGDRNFDRMVMGSATKPLWAVAVLNVHPEIHRTLMTRGNERSESDPFGIQFSSGWEVHPTANWINFREYLADSDNRYHVRLGLLGLAETIGGSVIGDGSSYSNRESLNGNTPVPWKKYPRFPPEINFSKDQPNGPIRRLNESELAKTLLNFFSFGITEHQLDVRRSFWTKDENDDYSQSIADRAWLSVFNGISPAAVDLGLDRIEIPRDYVSLLLGGGTNLWANPDFAAAFGSCITGQSLVAHLVRNQEPVKLRPDRKAFPDFAARVRPGLSGVLTDGTGGVAELKTALANLKKSGIKTYAKTGTLADNIDSINTSRIVLAIVNWENESKGKAKAGLVISLVVERGGTTSASRWLGQFILDHRSHLERFLGS